MIIDAGGGTVDLSSYTITSTTPIEIAEIAAPDCTYTLSTSFLIQALIVASGIFEGSVIVRHRAENYIRRKISLSCTRSDVADIKLQRNSVVPSSATSPTSRV